MTKFIAAAIIAVVLWGGWELFFYWERVKNEEETQQKEAVAATAIVPEQLDGLPQSLEPTLKAAERQGAEGLRNWFKTYGRTVRDPRKAWIELDYCQMLARENVPEARRVFAEVKDRTPTNSIIYPRIRQLEKTYQ